MTFLSIIIPFKKGKRYLKDCLDSIREQRLKDYEIILIVNGSDENIYGFTSKFKNITVKKYDSVIGVGKARNEGLKIATGEYVYFIDSDDYIYEKGLSKLVKVATNASFINGQRIETYYIKNRFSEEFSVNNVEIVKNKYSDEEFSMRLLVGERTNLEVLSVLHALIKRDEIDGIEFDESNKYYNDYSFMANLVNKVSSCVGVENAVYAKRISDDFINFPSLNQEKYESKLIDDLREYKNIRGQIKSDMVRKLMANKIFDYYYYIFSHDYILDPNPEYLDVFCDVADEFESNFIKNQEIKALRTNKQKAVKLMKIRVNLKRAYNLVKEPWRLYHIIYYYFFNKQPINDKRIVFESFNGRYYSDNPKYLYEYLYENYKDDFEFVWVLNNPTVKIPGNPIKVKRFSLKYHKLMATSKYWVINTRQAGRLVKRPEQVIISTWHGTPLKKLGFDMKKGSPGWGFLLCVGCYLQSLRIGSLVSPTPSFLKILRSTSLVITVVCIWQPSSMGRQSRARRQLSSSRLSMDSVTSTSSVCRRGLLPCSMLTLVCCMGSIIFWEMSLTLWSMPARCLRALSRRAAQAPRRSLVVAVMMVPSASSIAAEGTPSRSRRSLAATVVRRSSVLIFACFMSSAILLISLSVALPLA